MDTVSYTQDTQGLTPVKTESKEPFATNVIGWDPLCTIPQVGERLSSEEEELDDLFVPQ